MFYLPETRSYCPFLENGERSNNSSSPETETNGSIKNKQNVHGFSSLSKLAINSGSKCKLSVPSDADYKLLNVHGKGANSR